MHSGLDRRLAKLEGQKRTLLVELESWDADQLSYRSQPTEWSALDIVEHIARTEGAILESMRERGGSHETASAGDRLRGLLLTIFFLTPARVRVPGSARAVLPEGSADLVNLTAWWSATRSDLRTFVDRHGERSPRAAMFRHPVSGWMTLAGTLDFLSAHLVHHGYQLRRVSGAYRSRAG